MILFNNLFLTLRATLKSLADGKIWFYLFVPTLLALFVWVLLLIFSLGALSEKLMDAPPLSLMVAWGMISLAKMLALISGWISITGLSYLIGLLVTSIFILPLLLKHIGKTQYADLVFAGNSFWGSTALYSCWVIFLYVLLWVLTLPLWFVPGVALILPLVLMAWLNYKTYTFEILADFAISAEKKEILQKHFLSLFLLGLLLSLVAHLPILCLFAPGITALAFSHYVLLALKELRGDAILSVEVQNK